MIRSVMAVDSVLMGLSIADRFNQLRHSRQKAITDRYEEEYRNLKLLTRLSELEKRYAQEHEHLRERDVASADTLHDLRQPLTALRYSIRNLVDRESGGIGSTDDIEESFSYIERLMHTAGKQRQNDVEWVMTKSDTLPTAGHDLGLRKVTDSAMQMFLPDAAEKGLELRYAPSGHDTVVQPLAAMRILSNLLSNAIKYTETGGILMCVRKRGDTLRVEIHDTGPGLDEAEFNKAKSRGARLFQTAEGSKGTCLGLAIVAEISQESGYEVNVLCRRKTGLSVGVTFPIVGAEIPA